MARVQIQDPEHFSDAEVAGIFDWVTQMEGAVPNHFLVELNFPEYFKAKLSSTRVLWECGELSMEEIMHCGIVVSDANDCDYCTAAFCTILNHGLQSAESYVEQVLQDGPASVATERLRIILEFCLKVNADAKTITDHDIESLRSVGLSDRGIVQLVHVVSDFASYNRLNQALQTDFDYREFWRSARNS